MQSKDCIIQTILNGIAVLLFDNRKQWFDVRNRFKCHRTTFVV